LIATQVHEEGSVLIGEPKSHSECFLEARVLDDEGLFVSIVDSKERYRGLAILAVIRWLRRMAQTSDGMCRLISNAIEVETIRKIMVTDPFLKKDIVVPLHTLFLTLMADQQFKIAASRAYASAFAAVAAVYAEGKGTSQNSLFGLSVQFLNRYIYVEGMITELNFFTTLSTSLSEMLVSRRHHFPETKTLSHRRYYPIIADLKVIFTLPSTSRYFCGVSFDHILLIFRTYQFLHPQKRMAAHHVEFESNDWMVAFNLYIGISGLFDYFVNWFDALDSIESPLSPVSHAPLPTVFEHTLSVLSVLMDWQTNFLHDMPQDNLPLLASSHDGKQHLTLHIENQEKSFHIYLHRYFATCIHEATRFPHLIETIDQIQTYLLVQQSSNEMTLVSMLDQPLAVLVWETQIRAGTWRRNGAVRLPPPPPSPPPLFHSAHTCLLLTADERSNPQLWRASLLPCLQRYGHPLPPGPSFLSLPHSLPSAHGHSYGFKPLLEPNYLSILLTEISL
jgi:hypothetical protein